MQDRFYVDAGVIAPTYGVRRDTLLRWAREGLIPCVRVAGGRRILFDAQEVDEFMHQRPQQEGRHAV